MAELLTTDKLSELACVTLYMMYEKMNGKKSRWHHYIKELDRCDLGQGVRQKVTDLILLLGLQLDSCELKSVTCCMHWAEVTGEGL